MKLKEFLIKKITQENYILENRQSDFNISSNQKTLIEKCLNLERILKCPITKIISSSRMFQTLQIPILKFQYILQATISIISVVEIILRIFIFINNNKNEKYL
ncbi:unnamed protein product [Paramecium primaurelia]|uniref:Transmembrane protein n=1 Tax=Paramecium primaurelia TaxID=5886 RepID=A0A8S1PEF1_PARPR|nr:unnamed protein product [Paramecium primaurelia]